MSYQAIVWRRVRHLVRSKSRILFYPPSSLPIPLDLTLQSPPPPPHDRRHGFHGRSLPLPRPHCHRRRRPLSGEVRFFPGIGLAQGRLEEELAGGDGFA